MKGILFSPDMIPAIIEGRKSQVRRLSGLEEINKEPDKWVYTRFDHKDSNERITVKPRYHPGETVYIKEAWATEKKYDHLPPRDIPRTAHIHYMSDGVGEWPINLAIGRLRSPMFLMEWMARYFEKIKSVKAERLQSISWADCLAEGIIQEGDDFCAQGTPKLRYSVPQGAYLQLWDSINKPKLFNPWVWRYEFELVKA